MLLALAAVIGLLLPTAPAAAPAPPPAIVLLTQTTLGQNSAMQEQLTHKVRERFPAHQVRWATCLSTASAAEQLPDLAQVLAALPSQGVTQAVLQSLAVVPNLECDKAVADLQAKGGLKLALGKPLLSSLADRHRLLTALATTFTPNKDQAVLVLAGGSQNQAVLREYLALYTLLLAKFKEKNLFFGTTDSLPALKTALNGLKKSSASTVTILPLPTFVDGAPPVHLLEALAAVRADLAAAKAGPVEIFPDGLGSLDGILAIYVDHVAAALETLAPKKPERRKRGKK